MCFGNHLHALKPMEHATGKQLSADRDLTDAQREFTTAELGDNYLCVDVRTPLQHHTWNPLVQ